MEFTKEKNINNPNKCKEASGIQILKPDRVSTDRNKSKLNLSLCLSGIPLNFDLKKLNKSL